LVEREEISRGLAAGLSIRVIAGQLGRAASTISREVNGNGGRRRYRALHADRGAWSRASRPKVCKLARHPRLRDIVEDKLRRRWSPEQITREMPDRSLLCVKRNVAGADHAWSLGKEFIALLRHYQLPRIPGRAGGFFCIYWGRSARTATVRWSGAVPSHQRRRKRSRPAARS
jgi:hypothetical protein